MLLLLPSIPKSPFLQHKKSLVEEHQYWHSRRNGRPLKLWRHDIMILIYFQRKIKEGL